MSVGRSLLAVLAAGAFLGMASTVAGDGAGPSREPDVIYVPTPNEVVEVMLRLAAVTKDDVVYDLGCGDGRIVVAAAKKYGCRAKGFDIDPARVAESIANVKAAGVEHLAEIEEKDIFTLDLSGASVITLYLLPELNVRLIPQLQELKPGSRIVSHAFDMRGVTPDVEATVRCKDGIDRNVYLWTVPFEVDETEAGSTVFNWDSADDDWDDSEQ